MTDFNGQFKSDGVIPKGGAQFSVVTTTISGNLNAIMATELMSAFDLKTSAIPVAGLVCAEANYQADYALGPLRKISPYIVPGEMSFGRSISHTRPMTLRRRQTFQRSEECSAR